MQIELLTAASSRQSLEGSDGGAPRGVVGMGLLRRNGPGTRRAGQSVCWGAIPLALEAFRLDPSWAIVCLELRRQLI